MKLRGLGDTGKNPFPFRKHNQKGMSFACGKYISEPFEVVSFQTGPIQSGAPGNARKCWEGTTAVCTTYSGYLSNSCLLLHIQL